MQDGMDPALIINSHIIVCPGTATSVDEIIEQFVILL
jgi:hypothetical protein